MRHYSEDALRALNEHTELIDVSGVPVLVKPSPTEPREGYVDRVLWEQIKNSRWADGSRAALDAHKTSAELVEDIRDSMGGFNENLNSIEIYTKYEVLTGSGNPVGLWRYYPRRSQRRADHPALVFFHGGGWIGGSVYTVENACRYIAEKADAVVFNVDYSLAPEKPYPNGLNDNFNALRHICRHAADYGVDPERVAVCGDSAGGNYAAAVALMARDKGFPKLAMQVLIYPAVLRGDCQPKGYVWSEELLGVCAEQLEKLRPLLQLGRPVSVCEDFESLLYMDARQDPSDPYISPALAGTHAGLPRALLFAGEFDGLRLHTEYYASLLARAGVPVRTVRYRGLTHAFLDQLGFLPQAEDMCLEIASALKEL